MKKSNIALIITGVVLLIILLWGITSYNNLVESKERVEKEASNISVMLERRADLIPNLINTVKGYTKHEEEIIGKITNARENLLAASSITDQAKANQELSTAIDALMVVVENYPDLKASQNFINLQDELAGTENRIAVARKDYNEIIKNYNSKIKKFPTNIIASLFHCEKEPYFEAEKKKTEVPNVEF